MSMNQSMPGHPLPLPRAATPQQPLQPQPPPSQPSPQQQQYRQQHPQQQPAEAGTDPAAVIAARSAAVARNRQREARVAMLQDVLRILFVAVILGGVVWIFFWRHRHNMEEERLRIEAAQKVQEARAKEQREREERFEAKQDARRKEKQAKEAEEQRRRDEKKRADKERAEAARQRVANVRRYKEAEARFQGATLDLISAAPSTDLPLNVVGETWYSCVVPSGRSGMSLYEMQALPGKDIHVTRLEESGEATDVKFDEFSRQMARLPFLLVKGTRCYYKAEQKKWERRMPVPSANARLNPSSEDFRDLYDFAHKHCGKDALVSYEVFLREVGGIETHVLSVPFGGQFARSDVARGLEEADSGHRRGTGSDIQNRLNAGTLVIRRKGSFR